MEQLYWHERQLWRSLLTCVAMAQTKASANAAADLVARISEALQNERIIPRFVDSYVVQHGRAGVQVDATAYRELLGLLQREALIALSYRATEILTSDANAANSKRRTVSPRDATAFRRKYLEALARQQKWTAGDSLDFQKDFHVYEQVIAQSASERRRKPFEAANHPFVDRCAFLLDPSFLEIARLAASQALKELEDLAARVVVGLTANTQKGRPR